MKEKLQNIEEQAIQEIRETKDLKELESLRVKYLGKKGEITGILRGMGKLPAEERPIIGELANKVREEITEEINRSREVLEAKAMEKKLAEEAIDVTMPGKRSPIGSAHPLRQSVESLEDIFISMGFKVVEGPEIETVENNFDALNAPKNHPSRDMSDTFYITDDLVLRTQTSPVQIRVMKQNNPPIRVISPGRCFRNDTPDATHSPMFHQLEGLVIDKNITLGDLKGTLEIFAKSFFGSHTQTKFRPHHFPFTEPSAEMDITCFKCGGEGCSMCKGSGWIELLGAGMVHPNVLEYCGIDSEKYSGFAFGMGIDRITMAKYDIDDIRLFFENDQRFLQQFR